MKRLGGLLAVVLLVAGGLAVLAGLYERGAFAGGTTPPPKDFPVMERSEPSRIVIPALMVDARIHDVGLAEDGSIEVPDIGRHNEAGWFERSPTPGQFGPAVIVGHADTRSGPSVFARLAKAKPGTKVEIRRRDGSTAVFEINSVEKFPKGDQPIERIYADFTRPALRLITCGGEFTGGSTGYADNIVAFASLVEARP